MSVQPVVAVVVVNWNGAQDTVECLNSVQASHGVQAEFVVVDNASTDNSLEILRATPGMTLLPQQNNVGFAGGCNVGIRYALGAGADYIFLLNNDALVHADTLASLCQASRQCDDRDVLGCVVRYSRKDELQFFGSRNSPISGDPQWFREPEDRHRLGVDPIESDFVFGAALFAPRRLFEQVGLLDERFFLTYEETDWCYRARRAGARCLVIPQAVVLHHGSVSLGAATSPLQAYFLHRNKLLFLEKHATFRQWLRGFRFSLRVMRRSAASRAIARALFDYSTRRFGDSPPMIRRMARQKG